MNETSTAPVVPPSPAPVRPAPSRPARLLQGLPTLLVLLALGGLAYFGHQTGWKMPHFTVLGGTPTANDDWCSEHNVPESRCVECRPELMPRRSVPWCPKHGVHQCPFEHPEVAQLPVPPRITPADLERAQRALDFTERPRNDPRCTLHTRRIQFASQEAIDKQGVGLDAVWTARMEETITAPGEIGYDPTRVAALAPPVSGRVWRVEKELGQAVKQGEVLALVDAAEVGRAKAEFLQAAAQVDLRSRLLEGMKSGYVQGVIPEPRFREAEAALHEAQIRLLSAQHALLNLGLPIRAAEVKGLTPEEIARRVQFLGLPESITQTLDPQTTTANLSPVKAPLDGVVVERRAVAGELADPSKPLFVVADTQRMWLTLHVRLEDAKHLARGQTVRFRPDGGGEAAGKVNWISTAVDERTRTVQVRAELANPDGRLRANTFGSGTVVLREEDRAIIVPNEAVHWDGNCHVVFVWDKDSPKEGAPKVFHVRSVRPGAKDDRHTEIIAGVLPGEMVATKNSGVLRAQLLKGNLGAG